MTVADSTIVARRCAICGQRTRPGRSQAERASDPDGPNSAPSGSGGCGSAMVGEPLPRRRRRAPELGRRTGSPARTIATSSAIDSSLAGVIR